MGSSGKYSYFRSKVVVKISLLMVVIILSLTACTETPEQLLTVDALEHTVYMAYDPAHGANPYLTDAQVTHQLSGLLYTKLFELTDEFSITPELALTAVPLQENILYSVHIKGGNLFSDGSEITANDVVASILAAKNSGYYSERLSNIKSVVVNEEGVVDITLISPDAFFLTLLTMPILKANDLSNSTPLSSGDYILEDGKLILRGGDNRAIQSIELVRLSEQQALADALNMGKITLLDTTHLIEFVPNTSLQKATYPTTEMLFIGFAPQGILSSERRSIAALAPRESIVDNVYSSTAVASSYIINPSYELNMPTIPQSVGYLAQEYTILYNANISERVSTVALLESAFALHGVKLTAIAAQGEYQFNEMLLNGDHDLYLAEILLPQNLDFSYFFDEQSKGFVNYTSNELINAYNDMKATGVTEEFCNAFLQNSPVVPLLFKEGTIYHPDWITGLSPTNSNPYYRFFEVDYD